MPRSGRQLVRTAVGIAAVVPAIGLAVLAVSLMASGGFGGVLSGLLLAVVALALAAAALLWTHAPVTIARLLAKDEHTTGSETEKPPAEDDDLGGTNGHGTRPSVPSDEATNGHGPG